MATAVFLDRDGVINENRADHVKSWEEFRFLPGAVDAIARLSAAGMRVFVFTNQAIVNRGIVSHEAVESINRRMVEEIARRGGRIEAVAYCPHRPDEACACRKPEPGMLRDLADAYGVDLHDAVLVGDALSDIEAGLASGCRTILVLTGRGRNEMGAAVAAVAATSRSFTIVPDLASAVDVMLREPALVA